MSNNIKLFIPFTLNLRRNYVELTQGLVTCVKFTSELRRNHVEFTSNLRRNHVVALCVAAAVVFAVYCFSAKNGKF